MEPIDEILRGALAGDQAALDRLARWLRELLVRSFSRRFGPVNGEDLAHETIADILATLDRAPRDPVEFTRWVHGYGRNERLVWLAARRRELDRTDPDHDLTQTLPDSPGIDALFAAEEKRRFFVKLIEELPVRQRQVYGARLEGYSFAEIAAMLGTSLRTVERGWRTARAWLFQRLAPSEA